MTEALLRIKAWVAKVLSALIPPVLLLTGVAYMYLAYGLGSHITPVINAALVGGTALTGVGILLSVLRHKMPARCAYGAVILIIVGLSIHLQYFVNVIPPASIAAQNQRTQSENAEVLASAEISMPCTNGDTAVIERRPNTKNEAPFLVLSIVPADRTLRYQILSFSNSKFVIGPRNEDINTYLAQTGAQCRNDRFNSLQAVLEYMRQYYAVERQKVEHNQH